MGFLGRAMSSSFILWMGPQLKRGLAALATVAR
jgi:hypothetical protein